MITWRGLIVDLDTRTFSFAPKFAEKVQACVQEADRAQWVLPVDRTLVLVGCLLYITYVRLASMTSLRHTLCFLSRLATNLNNGTIAPGHSMRWPRGAADEARAVPVRAPYRLPPRAIYEDGAEQAFGVSDAAGPSEDGAARNMAYAYHTHERMVINVEPIRHTDIFLAELRAMMDGLRDMVEQEVEECLAPAALRPVPGLDEPSVYNGAARLTWLCDNLRAIFVVGRGWSTHWPANEDLFHYWKHVRFAFDESCIAYVPSRDNIMDPFTRSAHPGRREAPACAEHPGRQCPEFAAFVEAARVAWCPTLGADERRTRAMLSWRPNDATITFSADMPAGALRHLE